MGSWSLFQIDTKEDAKIVSSLLSSKLVKSNNIVIPKKNDKIYFRHEKLLFSIGFTDFLAISLDVQDVINNLQGHSNVVAVGM